MARQGVRLLRVAVRGLLLAGTSGILLAGAGEAGAAHAETGAAQAGTAQTGPVLTGPLQAGPAQINALARPDLCWQAGGNGAPVTLARCDPALQAQQWTLTSDSVLMTGTGYCLEATDGPLFTDFAAQCGGSPGQRWRFGGATGALTSTGTGICAVAGGPLAPGTGIVSGTCAPGSPGGAPAPGASAASATAAAGPATSGARRWSFGYSAVTVTAGADRGPAGGPFTAAVTVANAASAQAAYGVSIRLGLPRGVILSALRGAAGAAGWRCDVRALTCSGDLPAGIAERVGISGRLPATARRATAVDVSVGVSVAGTSPSPGTTRATALVRVAVLAAAPPATAGPGGPARGLALIASLLAGALVLGGGLLVALTRWHPAARNRELRSREPRLQKGQGRKERSRKWGSRTRGNPQRAGAAAQPPDDPDVVDVTHLVDITQIIEVTNVTSDDWRGRPGDPAATQPFDVAASWACDPTGVSSPPG